MKITPKPDFVPKFIRVQNEEFREKLKEQILYYCDEYKIRLAPKEFDMLIDKYAEKYINDIYIPGLIDIAESIVKENS